MLYEGHYNGQGNGELFLKDGPIFKPNEKIFVFDVDDTVLEKTNEGCRVRDLAVNVVEHAIRHFDRVVAWSMIPNTLSMNGFPPKCEAHERLQQYPFSNIDQRIGGTVAVCKLKGKIYGWNDERAIDGNKLEPVKNLRVLTNNLSNVVAMEDKDIYFDPVNCVVPYNEGENFWGTYENAVYAVGAMGSRYSRRKKRNRDLAYC